MTWTISSKSNLLLDIENGTPVFTTTVSIEGIDISLPGKHFCIYPEDDPNQAYRVLRRSSGLSLEHPDLSRMGPEPDDYEEIAEYANKRFPTISDELRDIMEFSIGNKKPTRQGWEKCVAIADHTRTSLDDIQWDVSNSFYRAYQNALSLNRRLSTQDAKYLSSRLDPLATQACLH